MVDVRGRALATEYLRVVKEHLHKRAGGLLRSNVPQTKQHVPGLTSTNRAPPLQNCYTRYFAPLCVRSEVFSVLHHIG